MIVASTNVIKPETYWSFSVYSTRNIHTGEKESRCLAMSRSNTIEEMLTNISYNFIHYMANRYEIEIREIVENCARCGGEGSISVRRRNGKPAKTSRCPDCNGVGGFSSMGPIKQPDFPRFIDFGSFK